MKNMKQNKENLFVNLTEKEMNIVCGGENKKVDTFSESVIKCVFNFFNKIG